MTSANHELAARGMYVGGEWAAGVSGETEQVINPATEEVIATAQVGSAADCERALAAARSAFDEGPWPRLTPLERSAALEDFHSVLSRRRDEIVDLVVAESGTVRGYAEWFHVGVALSHTRLMAEVARRDPVEPRLATLADLPDASKLLGAQICVREPVGVVAAITPFNFPFMLNVGKIAPALAMGNTAILKPSELTPLQALLLAEVADEIGLPPGVLNVITGGPESGRLLSTDPRVDMVSFTGSDTVGETVMRQASSTLKRVLLELGGKSALIVRGDADVAAAADFGAAHTIAQAGQGCALCTRHLVHSSAYPAYLDELVQRCAAVVVGDPGDPATTMGPLISDAQRGRVETLVDQAAASGATIASGGRRPAHRDRGFFYEPTVVCDVDNAAPIAQQEIFGPVATVIEIHDDAEAVRTANESGYGLSGAIFSRDTGRAWEMARAIRTGGVAINGGSGEFPVDAPFGGYKRSGLGREYGIEGTLEYTEVKTISMRAG